MGLLEVAPQQGFPAGSEQSGLCSVVTLWHCDQIHHEVVKILHPAVRGRLLWSSCCKPFVSSCCKISLNPKSGPQKLLTVWSLPSPASTRSTHASLQTPALLTFPEVLKPSWGAGDLDACWHVRWLPRGIRCHLHPGKCLLSTGSYQPALPWVLIIYTLLRIRWPISPSLILCGSKEQGPKSVWGTPASCSRMPCTV